MKRLTYQLPENGQSTSARTNKHIYCTDDKLSDNFLIARAEAYNGEVTVEDIPDQASVPTDAEQLRADVDYLLMLQEG